MNKVSQVYSENNTHMELSNLDIQDIYYEFYMKIFHGFQNNSVTLYRRQIQSDVDNM